MKTVYYHLSFKNVINLKNKKDKRYEKYILFLNDFKLDKKSIISLHYGGRHKIYRLTV